MERADIVIVGGGLAGAATAEEYRKAGGEGSVILLSQEPTLPVHRPPLSKEYLRGDAGLDAVYVHPADFYRDQHIDVRLESRVVEIDSAHQRVILNNGGPIEFGRLVLAPGARPRRLPVPGGDLPGVFSLRSLGSSDDLRAAYQGASRAVIIGAGFIGMEVASTLQQRGVACTVIEMAPRMWARLVPEAVATFIQRYYEDRGVQFRFGRGVSELRGNGRVESVVLDNGETLQADLVVAGVGVALNTEMAQQAGLDVNGGIVVNEFLRTSHPGIYAAGDVARFPDPIAGSIHLEHWDNALNQGRALGKTLAGISTRFEHVAYFFSDLFDLSLNMIGYPERWDDVVLRGNTDDAKFTAVYVREGEIRAALMINDDRYFDSWAPVIASRQKAAAMGTALENPEIDPAQVTEPAQTAVPGH